MSATTVFSNPAQAGDVLAEVEAFGARIAAVRAEIGRAIYGQQEVVDQTLITLLSGGHVLLVGVPGLGKSKLVETLAIVFGLASKRVQFTPDLMPADILGSEVLDEGADGRRSFRFVPGPVFCQLLMADEINRASPRTQSALLQAMQEQRVAVGGVEHPLPRPFHVLATQNPIEQEGTYPLPEAQVDRFMLKLRVTYPSIEEERKILEAMAMTDVRSPVKPVIQPAQIMEARKVIDEIYVDDKIKDYILSIVFATRTPDLYKLDIKPYIRYGASPRATIMLALGAKAHAFVQGRGYVTPQDVKSIAPDVLRHRVLISYEAEAEELTSDSIVEKILSALPVP